MTAKAKKQVDCVAGLFLVSFGAKDKLTEEDDAALDEVLTWSDVAVGRMVKHQIAKRKQRDREETP